jgi:excisionase family DNA binding protein
MSKTSRTPRMFAVAEIAEQLRVSDKTIRRWIERREMHVHRIGRQIRVSEEDLTAFLNKHRS